MSIIGALIPILSQNPILWTLAGIIFVITALEYTGKNAITLLKSTSPQGEFNWINALSGFLLAIASALTTGMATFYVLGAINWPLLWHIVSGVVGTYVVSTFFEDANLVKSIEQNLTATNKIN